MVHDRASYFDVTTNEAADVRKQIVNALEEQGIDVEASHHEVAMGQHEIDSRYADALTTADNALTFKITLKAIAQKHGPRLLYAGDRPQRSEPLWLHPFRVRHMS